MPSQLGNSFRASAFFHWYKCVAAPAELVLWRCKGSPAGSVPHLVKQRTIQQYARDFRLEVLVETGTNHAHMLYVQRHWFRELYSIELDASKAASARRKFSQDPKVHILEGDSAEVLPRLLPGLKRPCLFWLDGHDFDHSTPVRSELDALFRDPIQDHVILIDDAKWFDGHGGYPTLDELRQILARDYPGHAMEVRDEIIRIHRPGRPKAPAV